MGLAAIAVVRVWAGSVAADALWALGFWTSHLLYSPVLCAASALLLIAAGTAGALCYRRATMSRFVSCLCITVLSWVDYEWLLFLALSEGSPSPNVFPFLPVIFVLVVFTYVICRRFALHAGGASAVGFPQPEPDVSGDGSKPQAEAESNR